VFGAVVVATGEIVTGTFVNANHLHRFTCCTAGRTNSTTVDNNNNDNNSVCLRARAADSQPSSPTTDPRLLLARPVGGGGSRLAQTATVPHAPRRDAEPSDLSAAAASAPAPTNHSQAHLGPANRWKIARACILQHFHAIAARRGAI